MNLLLRSSFLRTHFHFLVGRIGRTTLVSIGILLFSSISVASVLDRVGVMGDSLSSEFTGGLSTQYVFGRYYFPYKSWVEQLAIDRSMNFGPYGYWGSYQNQGYQYNEASVYNITTSKLISSGEPALLRSQNPTLAVLEVGANDFMFFAEDHAAPSALFGGAYDGLDPMNIVPTMLANYRQAMEAVAGTALNPTGTEMVLATVPDITRTPIISSLGAILYPGSIVEYRAAIDAFNVGVRQLASDRNFAVLDLNAEFNSILGPPAAPNGTVRIGGVTFYNQFNQNTTSQDLFLHDGFHPNGILHSLIANELIQVVNQRYGTSIPLMTATEMLAMSNLTPVPEISSTVLMGLSLIVVLLIRLNPMKLCQ